MPLDYSIVVPKHVADSIADCVRAHPQKA